MSFSSREILSAQSKSLSFSPVLLKTQPFPNANLVITENFILSNPCPFIYSLLVTVDFHLSCRLALLGPIYRVHFKFLTLVIERSHAYEYLLSLCRFSKYPFSVWVAP